jgi:hypothetical protein
MSTKTYKIGLIINSAYNNVGVIIPYDSPKAVNTKKRIDQIVNNRFRGRSIIDCDIDTTLVRVPVGPGSNAVVFDNTPTSGVKIVQKFSYLKYQGYFQWQLKDPRGFYVTVGASVIGMILEQCPIVDSIIQIPITYSQRHTYLDVSVEFH